MPKEILLYGRINEDSASNFITQLSENEDTEIIVRVNSEGGSPECGFGMVAKLSEQSGLKKTKVDGKAYSMGLYLLCYSENNEALDVSEFLLHRAAYPSYIEENPDYFDDSMKANLSRINKSLRSAFEAKVDVAVFEKITGYTLDQVFAMGTRLDVSFNAKDAKKMGLINKINIITPSKKAEIQSLLEASYTGVFPTAKKEEIIITPKNNKMTKEEFKAANPADYAAIVAEGVTSEIDRVGSWLTFVDVDAAAVSKGIKDGGVLSATAMAELSRKSFSIDALKTVEKEAAPVVLTTEIEAAKTAAELKIASIEAEVKRNFNA